MRAIADECRLTERTVYRYFAHKADLVRFERDRSVAALLDLVRGQPPEARPLTAVQDGLRALHQGDPQRFMGLLQDASDRGAPVRGGPARDVFDDYATALTVVIQERLATQDPLLRGVQARVIGQVAAAVTRSACLAAAALPPSECTPEALAGLLDEAFASIRLA